MALGEGLWVSVPETMGSLWGLQRAQADAENKGGGAALAAFTTSQKGAGRLQ